MCFIVFGGNNTKRIVQLIIGIFLALLAYCVFAYDAKGDSSIVFVKSVGKIPATGVVVGTNDNGEAIVVTAGHIFDLKNIVVGDGKTWQNAKIIGRDHASDMSAILIQWNGPSSILSESLAVFGEDVWAWGATSKEMRGKRFPSPTGSIAMDSTNPAIGDSGAPIFSGKGIEEFDGKGLVGIITGHYTDHDQAGNKVRDWGAFGPNTTTIRRNLYLWGWNCDGGKCRRISPSSVWTPISPSTPIIRPGGAAPTAIQPAAPPTPKPIVVTGPRGATGPRGDTIIGPPGPQGPPGKTIIGPSGQIGPPGKDLSFIVELLGENGQVANTIIVPARGTLQLPPFTMTWTGPDGRVVSKTRPIGGVFNWKYFEKEKEDDGQR